jgi:hypothetical protein
MCRAWGAYSDTGRTGSEGCHTTSAVGLAQARQSGIGKGTSAIRARRGRGLSGRTSTGDTDAAGLLRLAWSADVEVLQGVVAVVADVEDLVVGQPTDGSLGVSLLGDMHPQGGAALTGVPK